MKTPEEIKKGLECRKRGYAERCGYDCAKCDVYVPRYVIGELLNDALTYIQQLERERDAAVEYLRGTCRTCIHDYPGVSNLRGSDCYGCMYNGMNHDGIDKWEWRDYRMLVTTAERLLDRIYDTLPDKTLRHMQRLCQYGQIIIRPRPAVKLGDDVQIVGTDDLRAVINSCVENECGICVKDRAGQKGCKLRKALMNIAPTAALHKDGSCAYLDVVAGNELGKYI